MSHKYPLPAGQLIEYYKGRLYVASDDLLYVGDPYADHYDGRRWPQQFEGYITLLRALETGIYIADGKTHYLRGESPLDFQVMRNVHDADAIIYTDDVIHGEYIGLKDNILYAIWTSSLGICVGSPEGEVTVVSSKYAMAYSSYRRGTCLVRKDDGKEHYIGVLTI